MVISQIDAPAWESGYGPFSGSQSSLYTINPPFEIIWERKLGKEDTDGHTVGGDGICYISIGKSVEAIELASGKTPRLDE